MKLLLSAVFATFIIAPLASAQSCDKSTTTSCDGGKCDKDKVKKDDGTTAGNCGKCDGKDKDKKEGTIAGNCDKCDGKDKDKKEGTVA